MADIKNLEMAEVISNNPNIKVSKEFLNVSSKATHIPANSRLNAIINCYSAEGVQAFVKFIEMAEEEVINQAKEVIPPARLSTSNCHHEACIADDKQFVATRVLNYADFRNTPIYDPKYFKGEATQVTAALLQY